MTRRCFSKCRGLKEQECTKPCSFVNQQYCRLSSTLKMIPPECIITKRAITISKSKRLKTLFSNSVCSETGCISFGQEKKFTQFFDFKQFTFAKLPLKPITNDIKQIKYERNGYKAYALLKSSKTASDNLAYEYLVGKYINRVSSYIPVFIETYGLFRYPNRELRDKLIKENHTDISKYLREISPSKLKEVCRHYDTECMLIQHMKDAIPLNSMKKDYHFFIFEALYVFYQVYFALAVLRKDFTHYDLQCQNVLLVEPVKNGYIEYHYHLPNETVSFKSKYIIKIKEFGRSYFTGSNDYYSKICKEPECPDCGTEKGFSFFEKSRKNDEHHDYVNSLYKNESHDLLLLADYKKITGMKPHKNKYIQSFVEVFQDTVYTSQYGTKEDLSPSDKVRNVSDAEKRFRVLIQDVIRKRINDKSYVNSKKIGDLHVYTDGKEQEFISQKNI